MKPTEPKPKRPAMACVLSEREALLLEQYGFPPGHCGQHGHRHLRHAKAALLVHVGRFRWVYPPQKKGSKGYTKFLAEVGPKGWRNVAGCTGHTTQQMVPGGIRA